MNLASRALGPELMDAPDIPPQDLEHALKHLETINRLLNGYGPTVTGIRRLLPDRCTHFTLLDVGCGSGDTLRAVAQWARKSKVTCRLVGIELSEFTARRAASLCRGFPEISVLRADLFELQTEPYDIVHSALVMHHLTDLEIARALTKMASIARVGVVINDLHRHWFAYHSIQLLTGLCSRSHVLRHDAPLSVARAFTRSELHALAQAANLDGVALHWHWAFRWCLTARGSVHASSSEA